MEIQGSELEFEIDQVNPNIGDALTVHLNKTYYPGDTVSVRIFYRTDPDAQAFSWMKPSQTAGGKLPYMYSQCEDINCRTMGPMQDTPANRITYSARVVTENSLVSRMSANITG